MYLNLSELIEPIQTDPTISKLIQTVVLNFPKMQQNTARISALASKMGKIKKVKAHYHPN